MRDTRYRNGFTLGELLVALMVTSIVLTAVATLAFALGTANDTTDDTSRKQAQVRCATLRISELIRHCKLICGTPDTDVAIWRADDNDDGKINPGELVYIESGGGNYIRFLEFSPLGGEFASAWYANESFTIGVIKSGWAKDVLVIMCSENYTNLIPQCSNAQFLLDTSAPQTQFVSVSFDLEENGVTHNYQINTSLRSWAGHLLDGSGEIVSGDDD